MKLVLATRNKKKIEEIRRITEGLPITIMTLEDFTGCPDISEDGSTFEENAIKKARAVAQYTGIPSLADDSGLEVYALDGAPGVLSARYAGEGADDTKNVCKLLREMQGVKERGARFVCCVALAFPEGRVRTFFGFSEGTIGTEPRGENGFGYDPVFYPPGYNLTFAEMSDAEKDSLSHRGRALQEFRNYLSELSKK